jgi:hypothetical protein
VASVFSFGGEHAPSLPPCGRRRRNGSR